MDKVQKELLENNIRHLYESGADLETLLGYMRQNGFNQSDSLLTLMRVTQRDKGELSDFMLDSKTWADYREHNLALRDALGQALLELAAENNDPDFKIIIENEADE